jgi:flavin reductase (DIM6/NTAB) family NADH-FMN oxidoreductase RutF
MTEGSTACTPNDREKRRSYPPLRSRPGPSDPLLRQVFGSFVTGVTVVTSRRSNGKPFGVTVSSFAPVSLDPPLILVCLNRKGQSGRAIAEEGAFAVNILDTRQKESAQAFSESGRRLDTPKWWFRDSGIPVLRHSLAVIECVVSHVFEAGDHDIFVGSVLEASSEPLRLKPLVYYGGKYRSLASTGLA